jgi:toxin FitB
MPMASLWCAILAHRAMPDSKSSRFLVDTNILSAGAPGKDVTHRALAVWMDAHSADLRLSVVTLTEIENGIAKAKRQGAVRKAKDLADWLESVVHLYDNQIIAIDSEIAREAGRRLDDARGHGREPGLADMLIAATARVHDLTVLTRNVRDFEGCGVTVVDPFTDAAFQG